jgi:glycine oxidase
MLQTFPRARAQSEHIDIVGAGIAGTWQALTLAKAGFRVTLHERSGAAMAQSASYRAGGMLAPHCEADISAPAIARLGLRSLALWKAEYPQSCFSGSLVVAHARDRSDFERFARLTSGHERIGADRLAGIEPALGGRFAEALFFPDEGHVEPRRAIGELHARLAAIGVTVLYESEAAPNDLDGLVIDCRGMAARDACPQLRGVKGETVVVETREIALSRPVRLIHPRWPLYIVPRAQNRFLIGATAIEGEDESVSVRSALELLSAAYAVHPAFAEARIVEVGAGLRPAFPDHLPRIAIDGAHISVNGLYRHGFLLAPALAELTLDYLQRGAIDSEVMQCM